MNRMTSRPLAALILALLLALLLAGGCASRSGSTGAAEGCKAAVSGCDSFDPGFVGGDSTTPETPTDTSIPGVIMVPPHYVNESEVASPVHSPPPCADGGTGFSLSIADGTPGYDTPQGAVDAFVADHPDYDTGATTWHIVYDGMEMSATSGRVSLDIAGLPNANWIVDAGERC